jgi:hypothetical protein
LKKIIVTNTNTNNKTKLTNQTTNGTMAFNFNNVQDRLCCKKYFNNWLENVSPLNKSEEIRLSKSKQPFSFYKSIQEVNTFNRDFCISEMPKNAWFQDKITNKLFKVVNFDNQTQEMVCICGDTGTKVYIDSTENGYYIGTKKKYYSVWADRLVDDIENPGHFPRILLSLENGLIIDIPNECLMSVEFSECIECGELYSKDEFYLEYDLSCEFENENQRCVECWSYFCSDH